MQNKRLSTMLMLIIFYKSVWRRALAGWSRGQKSGVDKIQNISQIFPDLVFSVFWLISGFVHSWKSCFGFCFSVLFLSPKTSTRSFKLHHLWTNWTKLVVKCCPSWNRIGVLICVIATVHISIVDYIHRPRSTRKSTSIYASRNDNYATIHTKCDWEGAECECIK